MRWLPGASRAARPRSTAGRHGHRHQVHRGRRPGRLQPARNRAPPSPRAVVNTGARRRSGPRPRRWDNWASIGALRRPSSTRSWRVPAWPFVFGELAQLGAWQPAEPRVVLSQSDSPIVREAGDIVAQQPVFCRKRLERPSAAHWRPPRTSDPQRAIGVQVQRADSRCSKARRHGKEPRV